LVSGEVADKGLSLQIKAVISITIVAIIIISSLAYAFILRKPSSNDVDNNNSFSLTLTPIIGFGLWKYNDYYIARITRIIPNGNSAEQLSEWLSLNNTQCAIISNEITSLTELNEIYHDPMDSNHIEVFELQGINYDKSQNVVYNDNDDDDLLSVNDSFLLKNRTVEKAVTRGFTEMKLYIIYSGKYYEANDGLAICAIVQETIPLQIPDLTLKQSSTNNTFLVETIPNSYSSQISSDAFNFTRTSYSITEANIVSDGIIYHDHPYSYAETDLQTIVTLDYGNLSEIVNVTTSDTTFLDIDGSNSISTNDSISINSSLISSAISKGFTSVELNIYFQVSGFVNNRNIHLNCISSIQISLT